jgi:hypothetical protein
MMNRLPAELVQVMPRDEESQVIEPDGLVTISPRLSAGPPRSVEPVIPSYVAVPFVATDAACPEGPDVQIA